MANYKHFIAFSASTNVGEGQTYATEAAKWAAEIAPYIVSGGKYEKTLIFREATHELIKGSISYGLSVADAARITALETWKDQFDASKALLTDYAKADAYAAVAATDTVAAAIGKLEAGVVANAAAIETANKAVLTYKAKALTSDEVTALGDENVKEAYKIVSVASDEAKTETQVGDTIKIYKDSSLKSADFVSEKPAETEGGTATAGQYLKLVYILANGSESTVYVDMSAIVAESEMGDGMKIANSKITIKLDAAGEAFLTVGADGLKLSGVQTAIDTAEGNAKTYTDDEIKKLDLAADATNAIAKDSKEYVQTTISETDGIVKNEGVAVTYGTFATGTQTDANKGIATVEDAKAYVDSQVSGKNVSAESTTTTYLTASAENNKVSVAAVTKTLASQKTEGAADGLATAKDVYDTITANEKTTSDALTSLDGRLDTLEGDASTTGSVAKSIADAVDALDVASTTKKDSKEYTQVTYSETNGKVSIDSVAVTYGTFAEGTQKDSNKGVATVEDAKAYVDSQVSGKNVDAAGDDYVAASAASNKVTVTTNVKDFTTNTPVVPTWNADGTVKTEATAPTLTGTANALADSAKIAAAIKFYADAAVAQLKAELENEIEWLEL